VSGHEETLATEHAATGGGVLSQRYLAVFELGSSRVIPLPDAGKLVVGRGDEAGLRLAETKVSRVHAQLDMAHDAVTVTDLESQNGTHVNGDRIDAPRVLVSGDVIEIGRTALVYHAAPGKAGGDTASLHRFRSLLSQETDRARLSGQPLALVSVAPATGTEERCSKLLVQDLVGVERLAADGGRFALLLPETDADDAVRRASGLVVLLGRAGVPARAGVAVYPADGFDADALLTSARSTAAEAAEGQALSAASVFRTLDVGGSPLVIADAQMLRLYALVERLAASDLPVLIQGETGAGKELAARALHYWSARRDARLVAVNAAALQTSLAESELFGHERGAFTGATSAKAGLLEAADGGSVFFDEIADLPLPVQVKLLRALDTGRVTRVGGVTEIPVDVRLIAATNKPLDQEVAQGRFRQDLYFRLSGATLCVPPLRDRPRELALLARRFLADARTRLGRGPTRISDEALQLLAAHPWPGNARELGNVMEYAAAAFDDPVLESWQLAERLAGGEGRRPPEQEPAVPSAEPRSQFQPLDKEIRELECTRMQQALDAAGGNQRRAAQLIGMPLRTFVSKLTRYGLRERDPQS